MYSPLRPPTEPTEVIQAEVVGRETIDWAGEQENVWVVVFRNDPGAEFGQSGKERARLWVRHDGKVLRQQIDVFGAKMSFEHLRYGRCKELQEQVVSGGAWGLVAEEQTTEL